MADTTQNAAPAPLAPASEPRAIVFKGVLVPDADSVRSMLYTLGERMKTDTKLAEQFKKDPERVLGNIGLCADIQTEVLAAQGIEIPEGCSVTCGLSCAITNIEIPH